MNVKTLAGQGFLEKSIDIYQEGSDAFVTMYLPTGNAIYPLV
jgi:hypothetical protein